MIGERVRTKCCRDCGMPSCPHCGCCTTPVWAVRWLFQCDCGWSGQLEHRELPIDVEAALAVLWDLNAEGPGDRPPAAGGSRSSSSATVDRLPEAGRTRRTGAARR